MDLDQLVQDAGAAFAAADQPAALENEKARFLGKTGSITELLKGLGKLAPEDKRLQGRASTRPRRRSRACSHSVGRNWRRPNWMPVSRKRRSTSPCRGAA